MYYLAFILDLLLNISFWFIIFSRFIYLEDCQFTSYFNLPIIQLQACFTFFKYIFFAVEFKFLLNIIMY